MTHVPGCDAETASVDVSRVVQLRAVLWSMRAMIGAAKVRPTVPRSLMFELQALAEAGLTVADHAMDEARSESADSALDESTG